MFDNLKIYLSVAIAIGIGASAWWAIRTWRNDIRKMVFEEMFADLVVEKNKELNDQLNLLKSDLEEQKKLFEQERINAQNSRNVTDKINKRTRDLLDGKPTPLLRATMSVIYEEQKKEKNK